MRKVIHIVRMWPTVQDPQYGSFIVAHLRALDPYTDQRIVIWDGQPEAEHLYAKEFALTVPRAMGVRAKWQSLKALLAESTPHILHVHGAGNDSALAFLRVHMLHGSRIRRIVTEHQSQWAMRPSLGAIWTLRLAHARTAVSGWLAQLMVPYSAGADIRVVPNILTPPELPLQRSEATHRRYVWVGDLVALKGYRQLLEAWAIHHRSYPQDTLTLIGHAVQGALTAKDLPSGATYTGPATPEEVHERMLHHDILVVNSEIETFSMVIGEALERGLSVLCTPIPGPQSVYDGTGITYRKDFSTADLIDHLGRAEIWSDAPIHLNEFRAEAVSEAFLELYIARKII